MLEVISSAQQLQSEASISLCDRKSAALNLTSLGSVNCEVLIDSPDDRSRILDILNRPGQFVSVIRNDNYSLINKLHINGVVEL
jgi:hypothetical protein